MSPHTFLPASYWHSQYKVGVYNPFKPSASNSEINRGGNLQVIQLFAACSIDWKLVQHHCVTSGAGKGKASTGAAFIMIDFFSS